MTIKPIHNYILAHEYAEYGRRGAKIPSRRDAFSDTFRHPSRHVYLQQRTRLAMYPLIWIDVP